MSNDSYCMFVTFCICDGEKTMSQNHFWCEATSTDYVVRLSERPSKMAVSLLISLLGLLIWSVKKCPTRKCRDFVKQALRGATVGGPKERGGQKK